jgi:hypothetical protein
VAAEQTEGGVMDDPNFKGLISESHDCVDCGHDTAPGLLDRAEAEREAARQMADGIINWRLPMTFDDRSEVYIVHNHIWEAAGMEPGYSGCLCIGCLEKRVGHRLAPYDFVADHPFNNLPGTPRLLDRRGHAYDVLGDFPEELLTPTPEMVGVAPGIADRTA